MIAKQSFMDYLNSFFQNIKDKLTNPFFGTLTFILIVHHWQFWYTLFTFDEKVTRVQKTQVLLKLIDREFTRGNLLCDIFWAIVITIIGYLIVVGTRALSLLIEFKIMPWITGKIVDKNVVLKTTHDSIVLERDEYAEKYEEQRKNVRLLSRDFDAQTEENKNKDATLIANTAAINDLTINTQRQDREIANLNTQNNNLKNEIASVQKTNKTLTLLNNDYMTDIDLHNKLFFQDEDYWKVKDNFPPIVLNKVKELKKDEKWDMFKTVLNFYRHGGSISGIATQTMEDYGLLRTDVNGVDKFTPLGTVISNYSHVFD